MKTTLLFSAAILLSAASFAQTAVSNQDAVKTVTSAQGNKNGGQLKSATSASSSTSVQTKAVSKAATKTRSAANKTEKAAVAEKNELAATAKTEGQQAKKAIPQDASVSAGAQSNARVTTGEKDNKLNENASINSKAAVSPMGVQSTGNQVKETSKATVVKASEKVKTSASATAHAIKPKPASVRMNTSLKAGAGIRIK